MLPEIEQRTLRVKSGKSRILSENDEKMQMRAKISRILYNHGVKSGT